MAKQARQRKTPEQRAAEVAALGAQLEDSVTTLCQDEAWRSMLRIAAHTPHYSPLNMLRLWAQAQARGMTLTRVASFNTWKGLGRPVRRGETGLKILAPRRGRLSEDEAKEQGPRGYDAQGRPAMVVRGWGTETVFDIAQTDGADLPETHRLAGTAPAGLWDALAELVTRAGFTLERETPADGADGYTLFSERRVVVREDVSEAESVSILAHELGHIRAEHETRGSEIGRRQVETEAESIAYVVVTASGLDSTRAATPYVAGWSGGDHEVMRAAAEAVHQAASGILDDLDALLGADPDADEDGDSVRSRPADRDAVGARQGVVQSRRAA